MTPNFGHYEGREQTYVKHLLLTRYLEGAAYKLILGRDPTLNFIDAFAGPWRTTDDANYEDASFSLAIGTLRTVQDYLRSIGKGNVRIRFRFCEKTPGAVANLRAFAARQEGLDIRVFSGRFEENLNAIADSLPGGFTITFIDPTGWNIETDRILAFLKRMRGELIFNFMSEEISRHVRYEDVSASYSRFLANPAWRSDFERTPEGPLEQRVLGLLKTKFRQAGVAKYLPDMAIRKPRSSRVKMRMILGTNSDIGVSVFRNVQKKVEEDEEIARHMVQERITRQRSLFDAVDHATAANRMYGVGNDRDKGLAEERLLSILKERPSAKFGQASASIMEEIPVRQPDLNSIARRLRKEGRIDFSVDERKRTPSRDSKIWLNGSS